MVTSLLSVIEEVDGFVYGQGAGGFYSLVAHDHKSILGYVSPAIARYFASETGFVVDALTMTITIDTSYDTFDKRNQLFGDVAARWKQVPFFEADLKNGWRDEFYTVYNPTNVPYFIVERAFSVLIGVVTYGVHINGYISPVNSANGKLKMWIPRRSSTKPTYPGMLDNTVAGGLGHPYGLWETVVKECFEEAGIPAQYVENHTKSVGVVSYLYHPKGRLIDRVQPEVEYVYDMEFEDETTVVPAPQDGEAEDFRLMDIDEILERMGNGEFKPNCGLVLIDFLIRHGIVTPATEPNYLAIVSRSHRSIPFPTM
ncbi:nudix-domain-containing protein 3 [Yamadazyma tenuis]|uniref:Nudix hydrolase domain-containing protein n=1 Tax=Candida tenuis (strain ATCC 10573 / BCRC 21748 / CBS 615 / JCM 9827 / NBRC 10315 / NRRL Y-1498 / VKM Y-70) TaxID=590646 RepID=G3BFL9_CANTC|nr:uncharacterized protein CANTEDRAFT_116075 [Yamadazyma tenuis ATCC 10573]EGV60050.1 hypothetical protein CANTEDRAFT_116075 [Yamadazyma tenuis ATCC 10573]WEJ94722.1 nudix-domain-containing protein 3 [Yamadazyma tenuis]